MANINIAKYSNKPAGIYREVINRAQQPELPFNQSRLVIGFSRKGPFNRPIRIDTQNDAKSLFGRVDKYLEKRNSYFHRSINLALEAGPVFALNLRNLNPDGVPDLVDGYSLSAKYGEDNANDDEAELKSLFNTDKFWVHDDENLINNVNETSDNLIRFANTGQGTTTVFVVKSDMDGFDVTASEWFDSPEDIPEWMDKDDVIGDYNVKVIVVKGAFGESKYNDLANSSVFGQYFDYNETDSEKSGLRYERLNDFLNLSQVEVLREFEGSLIPGLRNQDGEDIFIGDRINQFVERTGILFNINEDIFDNNDPINLKGSADETIGSVDLLSYEVADTATLREMLELYTGNIDDEPVENTSTEFFIEYSGLPEGWVETAQYQEGDKVENDDVYYVATETHDASTSTEPGAGADWETVWDVTTDIDAEPRISRGDLVVSESGEDLVKVIEANLASPGEYVTRVKTSKAADTTTDQVTKFTPVYNAATHINGFALEGFKMTDNHMPDGSWASIRDNVLTVLNDTNIGKAISDKDANNFRYLVDTFGGGIDNTSKSVYTEICRNRQNMFAIINSPSMEEFRNSTNPSFLDVNGNLDTRFIGEGGREGTGTFNFTLPGEAQGAYFGGYFGPHLIAQDGRSETLVPPAAVVSNNFVQKYQTAEPWTIVAGNDWTLSGQGIVGVEYELDAQDRKYFEQIGINPIVFKRNQGILIEGNMTAKQSPKSPLSSINGIEVVIYLQDQLEAILSQYQWRFNDEQTRLEIKQLADQACDSVLAAGGIFDYENVMDRSNNTDEIIDNELGVLTTYVEIARGMKILVNPLIIYRTGGIEAQGVSTT